jgi:hypothetical protein
MDTDLRNTRGRLIQLAIAAAIGGVLTFFLIQAMTHSGRGPNEDPVGAGSVGMLAIAVFVVTTLVAHKIITKKRTGGVGRRRP